MKSLFSVALEGENEEPIAVELTDEQIDADDDLSETIREGVDAHDAQERDLELQGVVLENLGNYITALEELVEGDEPLDEKDLQIVEMALTGANNEAARLGGEVAIPATESLDSTPRERAVLALEGLREIFHVYANAYVLDAKQAFDMTTDLFRTIGARLSKYEARIQRAQNDYNRSRHSFKETTHKGNMVRLWYHFSTTDGVVKDLTGEIENDLQMSTYVLTDYSKSVAELQKKLDSAVKSASIRSAEDVFKLAGKVQEMKHPAEDFDHQYVGGQKFLSVTGLAIETGSARKAVVADKRNFSKLAGLATAKKIVETSSVKHALRKVTMHPVESINSFEFSTNDIGTVIDAGRKYLENVRKYLDQGKTFNQARVSLAEDFASMFKGGDEQDRGAEVKDAQRLVAQLRQYAMNIASCFLSPGTQESARSIKAGKYCAYIAQRMLFQAR